MNRLRKFFRQSKKKLHSNKGESLAESLVSTLMIAFIFLILAGAIVTAAKINAKVKNEDVIFNVGSESTETVGMTIKQNSVTLYNGSSSNMDLYESSGSGTKYYYFEGNQ